MKKLLISTIVTCLIFFAGSGAVSAQDDGMLVIPVELFTCTYNNRQDPDDLDKVIDKWNAWADRNEIDDYAAWTLTPYYFGPDQEFDMIWLGAGKNAVALGEVQDAYLADESGLAGDFEEVISCNAHNNFASVNYKAPPEGETPANSVLTFSDCTYKEGASFSAVSAAMAEWSQYLSDAGSTSGIWHWYPVYGGGGEEFDLKWVTAHDNYEEQGADWDAYDPDKASEFEAVLDCDSARVYNATNRRRAESDDE